MNGRDPEKRRAWLEKYTASEKGRETVKNYYEINKEKRLAYSRKYYSEHAEERRNFARTKRQTEPEKHLTAKRKFRESNKEKINAEQRLYSKNNSEKVNALVRNRRARKLAAEGTHTAEDAVRIREKQNNCCVYCGVKLGAGRAAHLDHKVPLARGGSNWPDNLQWLCQRCNNRKSAKDPVVFAAQNGFLA